MKLNYMLNCIRQGYLNKKKNVELPSSRLGLCILKILCEHGFIRGYIMQNESLKILLKYNKGRSVISYLNISSKPPVYLSAKDLSRLYHKELLILTTSKGLCTSLDARHKGVGGYLLFSIL